MEMLLSRDVYTEDSSLGKLFLEDEFECYTLEDKLREIEGEPVTSWKVKGETAIPVGRYEVKLLLSARFGFVTPHLQNVPGFSYIEIHPGNTAKDTEGCILVGSQRDADSVSNSRIAFGSLMAKLMDLTEPMWLTVA